MEKHTHISFGSEATREQRLVWQTTPAPAPAETPEAKEEALEKAIKDPAVATEAILGTVDEHFKKNPNRKESAVSLFEARRERLKADSRLQEIKDLTSETNPEWIKMRRDIASKSPEVKARGITAANGFIEAQYNDIRTLARQASGEQAGTAKPPYNYLKQIDTLRENAVKTKRLDAALVGTDKLKDGRPDPDDPDVKAAKKALEDMKLDHGRFMDGLERVLEDARKPDLDPSAKRQRERTVDDTRDQRKKSLMKRIEEIFKPDTYAPVPPLSPAPPSTPVPSPSPSNAPKPPPFNAEEQVSEVVTEIRAIDQLVDRKLGRIPVVQMPQGPVKPKAKVEPMPPTPARQGVEVRPMPPASPEKPPENLEAVVKKFEQAVKDGKEDEAKKALDEVNKYLPLPAAEKDRIALIERLNKALTGNEKFKNKTIEFDKSGTKLVLVDKPAERAASASELPKNWLEQLKETIKLLQKFFEDFFKMERGSRCADLSNLPTARQQLEELRERQRQLRERAKTDPAAKKELDEVTQQIMRQETAVRRMEEQARRNRESEQKLGPYTTDNPESGVRVYTDRYGNFYMVGKTGTRFTASMIVEQERAIVRGAWQSEWPRGYAMPVVESAYRPVALPVALPATINVTQIGNVVQNVGGNVNISGDNIQAAAARVGGSPRVRPTATAEAPSAGHVPPTTVENRPVPRREPPAPSGAVTIPLGPMPTGDRKHE